MYLPNIEIEIKCAYCRCVLYTGSARSELHSLGEVILMELKAKGATVIERGATFAFIHPKSTRGVLIELAEE